jgi:acetyl-CoA decarbonylase/synthase complex subunit gamma
MGLSGIEIFKHLPKTNCGDCGVPTCLAFAMKLAQGQAELAACPYVSEEAKAALSEASAPPMRAVTVGTGDSAFTVGEETVMYRHDKTFVNPCAIGVSVDASASDADIDAVVAKALAADFERVGQRLRCGFVAVTSGGDDVRFAQVATRVAEAAKLPLLLVSDNATEMQAALEAVAATRPLVCSATEENSVEMLALAKAHNCPIVIRADGLEKVAEIAEHAVAMGVADLVIDSGAKTAGAGLRDRVLARRSALLKKFAPLATTIIGPSDSRRAIRSSKPRLRWQTRFTAASPCYRMPSRESPYWCCGEHLH